MSQFKPIRQDRLVDTVYDQLRDGIVSGDVPLGSRLVETRLAGEFGVSRGPVRLAIQRLIEEGLVVERPRQGAVVITMDAAFLIDLYTVRVGIERIAFGLAARNRINVAPLKSLLERLRDAASQGDIGLIARRELDFHADVSQRCGNAHIASIFHRLEGQLQLALTVDDSHYTDLNEVVDEHAPLIDVIEAGDAEAAMNLAEQHIVSSVGHAIEHLGGDPKMLLLHSRSSALPAG